MSEVDTKILPETNCPYCRYKLDAATSLSGKNENPSEGDISICLSCASMLQFDKNLLPQKINEKELLSSLDKETYDNITKARRIIREMDRSKLNKAKGSTP